MWCRPTEDLARRTQQEGEEKKGKKISFSRASAGSGSARGVRRWEKWLAHNGRRRTRRVAHRKEQHASCTWETELAIRILEPRFRVGPSLKPPRIVARSPPGRLVRSHLLPPVSFWRASCGFAGPGLLQFVICHPSRFCSATRLSSRLKHKCSGCECSLTSCSLFHCFCVDLTNPVVPF